MQIHSLALADFRNYSTLELTLHPQVTRVVGDNAQGKTNLIEALYALGRGRSFRTAQRSDLIRHDCAAAIVRARASTNGLLDDFSVEITRERNRFLRNGKPTLRPTAEWPYLILFAPEETLLFRAEPSARRDYFDAFITGLDATYAARLRNFRRVLQQRNRMLQQGVGGWNASLSAQLEPWTEQLIEYGCAIIVARRHWVDALNTRLSAVHEAFAGGDGGLQVRYHPSVADADEFRDQLRLRHAEEVARGMTVVGPQRDDFSATLAGVDLKHYGSQGQQRSVVISLKLAEVGFALERLGHPPILLLDDVASELDAGRIDAFFSALQHMACQIILTTVHLADRFFTTDAAVQTVTIRNGSIVEDHSAFTFHQLPC